MEKKDFENKSRPKKIKKKSILQQKYNITVITQQLKGKGQVSLELLKKLINQSSAILQKQPTMLKLASPAVVVGDIHGQFFDLLNIFQKFGNVAQTCYLFLGDYVDRGKFCIQVMTLILALKINYPNNVYLLRGNHEGRTMTTYFNFKTQCDKKYNNEIYQIFVDLFMKIPLCALIDNKYFAVHGGISPNIKMIADIDKINRFAQIPESGPLCDLLWSDPLDQNHDNWMNNKMRSCSYYYSRNQTIKFLNSNNIKLIIRGHQVQMKGYKYQYNNQNQPLTLTIFSAPKYCDTYKNKGAVAIITKKSLEIRAFRDVQHPFVLNNYLNSFELSFPYLASSVTKIFAHILKNPKVRLSLKPNQEVDLTQILRKIDNVQQIQQVFNLNSNQLSLLMASAKNTEKQDCPEQQISQNLLGFIQFSLKDANQKLPNIFGPKCIEFVRIRVNTKEQEEDVQSSTQ